MLINKRIVVKFLAGVFILMFICLVGCKKEEETEKEFMDIMTESSSYYVEGVMESFYVDGRKQNEFKVYYKSPDKIKVVLNSIDSDESQIILRNTDGVYVLIPKINKNFKIQSEWPTNASYPYLLTSLTKDIANATDPIITEDDETKTFELDTHLYKDAVANKQKIILDKETNLPTEVLIYDNQGNLYIRVVFTKIDLDIDIDDKEFVIDDTMTTLREMYEDSTYENRTIKYPVFCPEGCSLKNESTVSSTDGIDVVSVMTFDGEYKFTIIQQYQNAQETIGYAQESGEIICLLGVPVIIKDSAIQTVYNGIEYIIASNDLPLETMMEILSSYMTVIEEK